MPGRSWPYGVYTRSRWPSDTSASLTGSAMPYSIWIS